MKTYDMRFDAETMAMLQNLKGSVLKSIRSDAEALPSSAYGIAEIITSRGAYALTSIIEVADYFGALEDVAMFRLFPSTGNMPSRLMNTDMTNIPVEEMIQEIQIVNEHQELFHLGVKTYDVQVTRGIIFLLQNGGGNLLREKHMVLRNDLHPQRNSSHKPIHPHQRIRRRLDR